MKRLSTASSNEIQLNRDDTDEFDTTKLLDDSPLHNPIKFVILPYYFLIQCHYLCFLSSLFLKGFS